MTELLPYGTQWIDDDDIAAVTAVLRGGLLTQGPVVTEFERALASYVGARYCVAFCNATAGLHCAVRALDIPEGKEGITSAITFVASANCLAYSRLKPTFADIDARTFNVTADTLRAALTAQTAILIPVHFAGQAVHMDAVAALADEAGLAVIEDAAHAIGSCYADGSKVGNCRYSRLTVFSFHPVKTLTTGEGGAVTTNDPELYERLLLLRSHGITKDPTRFASNPGPWYHEMVALGYNYRLTDLQCALGLSQLGKLEAFKRRRREIVIRYNEAFAGLAGFTCPHETPGLDSCFHLYAAQIDFARIGKPRDRVMQALLEKGVGTQVHYIPVHTQPWYAQTFGYAQGMFPVAEEYYRRALSLPLFPRLTNADVDRVVAAVRDVLQ